MEEHEVLIAYQWLDAQKKIKSATSVRYALKYIIQSWAERYVSWHAVVEAGKRHPEIFGDHPHFNINAKLTKPKKSRLDSIKEAGA